MLSLEIVPDQLLLTTTLWCAFLPSTFRHRLKCHLSVICNKISTPYSENIRIINFDNNYYATHFSAGALNSKRTWTESDENLHSGINLLPKNYVYGKQRHRWYFPVQELSEALNFKTCTKITATFYILKQTSFANSLSLQCQIIQT